MGNHIEEADAATLMCASPRYASGCNTLVTTPSTTSPTLQVWAACSLSHNSPGGGEGRELPHITKPVRQFLMAEPAPWPDRVWHMLQWRLTGRQTRRNIRGALAPKQSIVRGNPALPMTHIDGARWTKSSAALSFCAASSLRALLLIDDTQHSSSFSFQFLVCRRPFSSSTLPPSTWLPILYTSKSFSSLLVAWIRRSLNPDITRLSIPGSHSAFIPSFQHPI